MKDNYQMRYSKRKRVELDFRWPEPPLNIVLIEPEIPPNTGNIARLCAATGTVLHLVEPLGFHLTDKHIRRAGLDYWEYVDIRRYPNLGIFFEKTSHLRKLYFSTSGTRNYTQAAYHPGDCLVFGNESHGLPDDLLAANPDKVYNIPIQLSRVRSLNLANSASIVLYEALRQLNA